MVKRFSKGYTHAVIYTSPEGGIYLLKKCHSPSDAFDFVFSYNGSLDKTRMGIYANADIPSGVVEMSEQDFLATVRHPVQKHFSKKPGMLIPKKRHNTIY